MGVDLDRDAIQYRMSRQLKYGCDDMSSLPPNGADKRVQMRDRFFVSGFGSAPRVGMRPPAENEQRASAR